MQQAGADSSELFAEVFDKSRKFVQKKKTKLLQILGTQKTKLLQVDQRFLFVSKFESKF